MSNFVTAGFAFFGGSAKLFEGFEKERLDVVRLQTARVGTFHIFADALYLADIHGVVGQRPFFKQGLKLSLIHI